METVQNDIKLFLNCFMFLFKISNYSLVYRFFILFHKYLTIYLASTVFQTPHMQPFVTFITYATFATMSLRFTASNLSRIKKQRTNTKSLISPLRNSKKQIPSKKDVKEPLVALQPNVPMDFHLKDAESVLDGLELVLNNQWAEITNLHERYYSQNAKESCDKRTDLLFLLRGLAMETKAAILKYRAQQLPTGGVMTLNQLYSLYEYRGNTFVDQSLELCVRNGKLRRFIITNALPVILRAGFATGTSALSQRVTYGYENTEVVTFTESYLNQIESDCIECQTDPKLVDNLKTLKSFENYIELHPSSLSVTNEMFTCEELKVLVEAGYLTLTSNHHNEIDVHQYSIAFPRCGTFLKMINCGRVWLVQVLSKASFKELLEDAIFEKWEGKKLNNFRRPYYGYDLLWILADAKGAGVIEAFTTPVGKAWRLTGKL